MASSGGYSISQGFFSALGITGGVISVSIALLAVYFCREFKVRASTEKAAEISLSEKLPVLSCSMVLEMKAGKGDMQCCAVCLVEFGDGQEQVRLLPKCGHCFHPSCIDAWIDSHLSCPICRTRLIDRQGSVKPAHLAIAMQD